nr:hypothetical protein [Tanacetum cinerariifolium]
ETEQLRDALERKLSKLEEDDSDPCKGLKSCP